MKNLLRLAIVTIALVFGESAYSQAHVGVGIYFGTPPPAPPPRREIIVARPYPEAVWVPGYWSFDRHNRHYSWIAGRWNRPPHSHSVWVAPRWKHQSKGYYYSPGHWHGRR